MKILKLIFLNIYKLFKESRSILFFILAGIIFASYGIFFYSGYFMYNYFDLNYSCELDITVDNNKNTDQLKSLIDEIIDQKGFNRIILCDDPENQLHRSEVIGLYEKNFAKHILYGEAFSYDTDQPYAVVAEETVSELGFTRNITGERISYKSKDFDVKGIYAGFYSLSVPPYFYAENLKTRNIHCEFDDIISAALKNKLKDDGFDFELIQNNMPFKSPEFIFCLFIVIAIFSLSFINILTMFSFWTAKMKQTFKVYYIYGCNHTNKFFIVTGQVFFISLIGTFIGFTVFISTYKLLGKLRIVYDESILNYIFVLLFTVFILLLLSVYFGIKVSKTQEITFRSKE